MAVCRGHIDGLGEGGVGHGYTVKICVYIQAVVWLLGTQCPI